MNLTCELCQSTDFVKEGDFFVCQTCGMKYTVEDARARVSEQTAVEAPAQAAPEAPAPAACTPAEDAPADEAKPFDMQRVAAQTAQAIAAIDANASIKEQISARNKIVAAAIEDSIEPYSDFVISAWQEAKYKLDNMSKVDRNGYGNFSLGFDHDTQTMHALNELTNGLNAIIDEHIAFAVPAHLNEVDMEFFDVIKTAYRELAFQLNNTPFYRSDESGAPTWRKECKPRVEAFEKTWDAWTTEKLELFFAAHPEKRSEYEALVAAVKTEQDKVNKAAKKARFFVRKEREKASQSEELDAARAAEEAFRREAIAAVL